MRCTTHRLIAATILLASICLAPGCGSSSSSSADPTPKGKKKAAADPAGTDKPADTPDPAKETAGPKENDPPAVTKTPEERLIGTWDAVSKLDETNLEAYLEDPGMKGNFSREELLESLKERAAAKGTMEFRKDGTLISTFQRPGREPRTTEGEWEVEEADGDRVKIGIVEISSKGRLGSDYDVVFHGDDEFRFEEGGFGREPIIVIHQRRK